MSPVLSVIFIVIISKAVIGKVIIRIDICNFCNFCNFCYSKFLPLPANIFLGQTVENALAYSSKETQSFITQGQE
jgi:hypothetical protein